MISETEIAYMAGIVDGEGCIRVYRQNNCNHYVLNIEVANTDERLLIWIQERFGGSFTPHKKSRPNRKQLWSWRISSRDAESFIKKILPYLLVKKEQAELAIRFRESFAAQCNLSGKSLPADILNFREQCYQDFKNLKRVS